MSTSRLGGDEKELESVLDVDGEMKAGGEMAKCYKPHRMTPLLDRPSSGTFSCLDGEYAETFFPMSFGGAPKPIDRSLVFIPDTRLRELPEVSR